MNRFRTATSVAAFLSVLAVPAAAHAATKTVYVGTPPKSAKQLPKNVDINAFFPDTISVNVGDSVSFIPAGFHDVNLPAKGKGAVPFLTPNGTTASGVDDAAGTAFWFNGHANLGFNPVLLQSGFGKRFSYSGAKQVASGLPLAAKPKPMTVKFTKAGSYKAYCDLHPGMILNVKVLKKGKAVPTAKQDAAAVAKQFEAAKKASQNLSKQSQPANTVSLGTSAKGGVEYFGMVPSNLTVKAGTTVKFQMSKNSFEAHTATFGPGNIEDPNSYIGGIAASLEAPTIDPRAIYPSDVTPVTYGPTTHGNGFWNSGPLDPFKATPLPNSSSVTFGTPGTYTYYCLIHPFMVGTITVQ